ncbi:MAG: hypothetical protein M1832_003000 [Thelocarpon impressellum]|nr:MAG: hypothetical protein M1832_003000 [Thelocarpon impressellum]
MSASPDQVRAARLATYFKAVLAGRQELKSAQNGALFIEAVCDQPDPAAALYDIVSSKGGLAAVQACLRFSLAVAFFNGPATALLCYLQEPTLKPICGGDILRQVLVRMVKPPIFWNAFIKAYRDSALDEGAIHAFAWLLAELLTLPTDQSYEYHELAQDLTRRELLLSSSHFETRTLGQKIKHILVTFGADIPSDSAGGERGPGGRHDNDHVDFRQIAVLPTADELTSSDPPYLLTADAVDDAAHATSLVAMHLDHQFRLLREDMLFEMRDELQIVQKLKKGVHKGLVINNLSLHSMSCGPEHRRQPWAMVFRCHTGIPGLFRGNPENRRVFLTNNRHLFRNNSVACLLVDDFVVAFPTISRDEELLAAERPRVVLQFTDMSSTANALLRLKNAKKISLVQIDTAVFSFAPILRRLQQAKELPLLEDLLAWDPFHPMAPPPGRPLRVIGKLRANPAADLRAVLGINKSVMLDASQMDSLLSGLTESVTVIHGPPGTGKSFIGALIAKVLHDWTKKTILVVCYTNHALDQFLEDLLDNGIQADNIVRLGGKSTVRTKPLALMEQFHSFNFQRPKSSWQNIDRIKSKLDFLEDRLKMSFAEYRSSGAQKQSLLQYLEFEDQAFYDSFTIPQESSDMIRIGKKGRMFDRFYLLDRWIQGTHPGIFAQQLPPNTRPIWDMDRPTRLAKISAWRREIDKEEVATLTKTIQEYNDGVSELAVLFNEKNPEILRTKRIIGCTTTAAAMYTREIQSAAPDVLLVEEAGEILESHVLTALGPKTTQMILIGDHRQLRPKYNNYRISVEKGEGFDFNRSLFERLVLKGFPHQVLTKQHRMRPEISSLIRDMTYPDLVDGPSTQARPDLRGFRDNVIFVDHRSPEDELSNVVERRDTGSSKENSFEGFMILKCVRYLAQQGYGSDKIVILTPYLGQLKRLRDMLQKDNDPILNDLDSFDLVRAGLLPAATAQLSKQAIRLATIGTEFPHLNNYQGEESDIVIVSLTRSNTAHDIGFMSSPERLNVLVSRARNALILIGNSETFLNARKGKDLWVRFLGLLKQRKQIYDGFPVKCERHPDRVASLRRPEDFDDECPDGGCKEPWKVALLEEGIARQQEVQRDKIEAQDRQRVIEQKEADLAAAKTLAHVSPLDPLKSPEIPSPSKVPDPDPAEDQPLPAPSNSVSKDEWQRQKAQENASNEAIDSIMDMIGLEAVKAQILRIKAKIEATTRQGTDLRHERFNVALLGNPGTGKTTVARLYAKFLGLLQILPGTEFVETTGSRLANDGVAGVKKHMEQIQNAGGGALFVDEAYQLTSDHNHGGRQVLDFLLAEMENQVGKIVFLFAGYNKEMEKFFEHNPGLARRIPFTLQFADYEDDELLRMLGQLIEKKYKSRMKVECGMAGLYARISVRRLGRGRGRAGFGNAGALQNMLARITERQADRLNAERRDGIRPDDFFLKKDDLIGPDPSKAILKSKSRERLQKLIGLDSVKSSIESMIGILKTNYLRELNERPPLEFSLNRLFLGNPGTGKTSVAKLYGQILVDLGMLSNGEVVVKTPADFIGGALGQSEQQTKAILATTSGKVLIVDEAYSLYSGKSSSDPYKSAVIDALVAEVQSTPGENRCVLLLGYEDQMLEMLQNVNPGLSRRFPVSNAFRFDDFSDSELRQILEQKLQDSGLEAVEDAKNVAGDILRRARNQPHFGNAGEIDNLLNHAKTSYQTRQMTLPAAERAIDGVLQPRDFDDKFDRDSDAEANLQCLFSDVIGCEGIVAKLKGYLQIARGMKERGLDPRDQIPMCFVFKGPPGTGKTTTARKMGKIFYDMGFLSSDQVIEASATDLVAQYVGQTGPKTQQMLEKGLGKVLFIDEAYRLSEGHFASEAIDELVDQITKPRFLGKVVVILAGYDADINKLMAVNSGLSSRFSEEILFHNLTPQACLQLLDRKLRQKQVVVAELHDVRGTVSREMMRLLGELAKLPFWGNARDVQTLAKSLIGCAFSTGGSSVPLVLAAEEALQCVKTMLAERRERSGNVAARRDGRGDLNTAFDYGRPQTSNAPRIKIDTVQAKKEDPVHAREEGEGCEAEEEAVEEERDDGVPDSVWSQLQADKREAADLEQRSAEKKAQAKSNLRESRLQHLVRGNRIAALEHQMALQSSDASAADDEKERDEQTRQKEENTERLKRDLEPARVSEALAQRDRLAAKAEFERICKVEERRRQVEAQTQAKLRSIGVCMAGFRWIPQAGGYRCAGGSHFVSNAQLNLEG